MKPPTGVPRIRDYFRYARRGLIIVLVATAASAGLGWFNWWGDDPIYKSTATLFIETDGAATPVDAAHGQLTASGLSLTYSQLATSRLVTSPTIEQLKLDETDGALAERIQVAPTKSVLLQVSVLGFDADLAQRTANTVAHNMISVSQTWPGLQATKSHLVLVDDAGAAQRIGSMWLGIATAAALGFVFSLILVIARSLIVDRLVARDQADRASMALPSPPPGRAQTFAVRDSFRLLTSYGWVIVVLIALGAAAGWATTVLTTREYQSVATLFAASTQSETTISGAYIDNTFATNRVASYVALATSDQVAARVVSELGLSIPPEKLQAKITAVPLVTTCGGYGRKQGVCVPGTVLFTVAVNDPNPARAQVLTSAVADQVVEVVGELETARAGGAPPFGVLVVDDASYPDQPQGFSLPLRIGVGAVGGLALGVLVFVLAGVIDRRVRSWERVEALAQTPVIGVLPTMADGVMDTADDLDAFGSYAERLRELRTNVRSLVADDGLGALALIAVTSPSRGDGRSTVAVDLAVALSETGKSVLLVDGDLYEPALAARLALSKPAIEGAATRGVATVLTGDHTVAEAVIGQVTVRGCSIAFLPAGPSAGAPGQLWATERATALMAEVGGLFDYVIIDTPPLDQHSDGALVAGVAGSALVVARIHKTKSGALRRAVHMLRVINVRVIGAVVTREPSRRQRRSRNSDRRRMTVSREKLTT